ncbi:MAG: type II toxin-antitoxin system prevent-host-death family antitoxin [Xanthomonadales bacterium]|nr:type II toxin-antitoxin system prevent-host-death family antitoxin [Xanthomonadales bacterium]MBP7624217.1 type II toxin-antitoxin system prevent-host-death family antitoxin [Xanthomonadales bacterium]
MSAELVTTLKCQSTPVDVEIYELMQQRISLLEGIARGEMAVAEGRVLSHADAKQCMARWLK